MCVYTVCDYTYAVAHVCVCCYSYSIHVCIHVHVCDYTYTVVHVCVWDYTYTVVHVCVYVTIHNECRTLETDFVKEITADNI